MKFGAKSNLEDSEKSEKNLEKTLKVYFFYI